MKWKQATQIADNVLQIPPEGAELDITTDYLVGLSVANAGHIL